MRTQSTSSQMFEVMASIAAQASGAGKTAAASPDAESQFKEILNEALGNGKTASQENTGSRKAADGQETVEATKKEAAAGPQEASGEVTDAKGEEGEAGETGETEVDAEIAAIAAGMMQQPAVVELFTGQMEEEPGEGEPVTAAQAPAEVLTDAAVPPRSAETQMPPAGVQEQAKQVPQGQQAAGTTNSNPVAETDTPATAQAGGAPATLVVPAGKDPVLSTQVETPQPQNVETPAESPAEIPPAVLQDEAAQQKFDSMIAGAKEKLGMGKDVVLDANINPKIAPTEGEETVAPQKFEVPEELRAQVPAEVKEKAEQPQVVRAMEKNARSSVQTENPEEIIMANYDATRSTVEVRTQTAPMDKAANPVQYDPAQQIQAQVIENLEKDTMEFRMQLSPQELGKIDVKMVLENGRLTVEIISAATKTNELLSRQTEALAATLRASGMNLQTVQIVTSAQEADSHLEQSLNMMNQQGNEAAQNEEGQKGRSPQGSGQSQEQDSREAAAREQQVKPKTLLNYTV